jgi:hypothetical protein
VEVRLAALVWAAEVVLCLVALALSTRPKFGACCGHLALTLTLLPQGKKNYQGRVCVEKANGIFAAQCTKRSQTQAFENVSFVHIAPCPRTGAQAVVTHILH